MWLLPEKLGAATQSSKIMEKIKNNKNFEIKTIGKGKLIVCVVAGVHGDESIGKKVIETIHKTIQKSNLMKGTLKTVIANPIALQNKKRFIDADLNRCFPGKRNGNCEERRAFELRGELKQADFVIDIHSTTTDTKDLAIIKKQTPKIKALLRRINPKHVALMPKGIGDGSLINHCSAGVSFEYGPHGSMYTYRRCLQDIIRVLFRLRMIKYDSKRRNFKTAYFRVCGTVRKPKGIRMRKNIKNFELVRKGEILGRMKNKSIKAEENFYPVLFGPKAYKDIMGFKARKIKKMAG